MKPVRSSGDLRLGLNLAAGATGRGRSTSHAVVFPIGQSKMRGKEKLTVIASDGETTVCIVNHALLINGEPFLEDMSIEEWQRL